VEDDFLVLREVATVLSNAGARVVKCTTIEQALEAIDRQPCDAAILDIRLRRETIAPVARKLSEKGVPFFFYTGQVQDESMIVQWPQVRIVSKPAMPTVLIRAITALLQTSAAPRAHGL
jgi:DNA-binding response OmpR family regulator